MTARLRRWFNRVNYSLLHFCSWLTRRLPRRSRYPVRYPLSSTADRSRSDSAAAALLPAEVQIPNSTTHPLVLPSLSSLPAAPISPIVPAVSAAPAVTIPELDRSRLVMGLLDEAWSQGRTTYPQLIAYVKAQSGAGCSKRTIANWKRLRGLLDETA